MKKIALTLIFASAALMAAEANATAAKADAGKDGSALFAKCVSCHGAKGDQKALGKSDLIGGWEAAKVEEALKGYKAGSRNVHGMGGVMKGQVATYSDADIKAVAEYISKLK